MRCFKCKYYSGELFLSCAIDPITAATSPREGCRNWEPKGEDDYQPVVLRVTRPIIPSKMVLVFIVLTAIASLYAIVRNNINTNDHDPYELSPPGSVQHIRED